MGILFLVSLVSPVEACISSLECANAGEPIPITGTSYVQWECIDGICVQGEEVNVECTLNAVCQEKYGEGYLCDLSTMNYGNCIKSGDEWLGYCGDGKCESVLGETQTSCPQDCDENYREGSSEKDSTLIAIIVGFVLLVVAIIVGAVIIRNKKRWLV